MDAQELTKTLIGYNTVSPLSNVEVSVTLGPNILRTETAAIAAVAVATYEYPL